MARTNEAADGVTSERIATGIHAIAAATIAAPGASEDELEIARRVLLRDPPREAPRESEGAAEAFNRQMDACIESCNESAGESTRAIRRIRLAKDLDRADLVLVDRNYLAGLIADRINLEHAAPGFDEDPEPELADDYGEPSSGGGVLAITSTAPASSSAEILGLEYSEAAADSFARYANSGSIDVGVPAVGTTSTWVGELGGDPLRSIAND